MGGPTHGASVRVGRQRSGDVRPAGPRAPSGGRGPAVADGEGISGATPVADERAYGPRARSLAARRSTRNPSSESGGLSVDQFDPTTDTREAAKAVTRAGVRARRSGRRTAGTTVARHDLVRSGSEAGGRREPVHANERRRPERSRLAAPMKSERRRGGWKVPSHAEDAVPSSSGDVGGTFRGGCTERWGSRVFQPRRGRS